MTHDGTDMAREPAAALSVVAALLRAEGLRVLLVERVRLKLDGSRPASPQRLAPELEISKGPELVGRVTAERGGLLVVTRTGPALTRDPESAAREAVS
ncbi:hypothetical protein [Nonomuraea sp. NPDC050540]|uniref:hypothetical protein n=1 Tax=Nonomuraea sp. NPDC050540 TaxID=3364367 RepID=UPI0037B30B9F